MEEILMDLTLSYQSVKFYLSILSNCIVNTGSLRDYPSIFPHQNFALYSIYVDMCFACIAAVLTIKQSQQLEH